MFRKDVAFFPRRGTQENIEFQFNLQLKVYQAYFLILEIPLMDYKFTPCSRGNASYQ